MSEPIQLELPCVVKHEGDLDYYYERADRHRLQLEKARDKQTVYIYDLSLIHI